MEDLEKLNKKIRSAHKKGELDQVDALRAELVEAFPDAPEADEARYRLGLSKLLRAKDLPAAEALFKQAADGRDEGVAAAARLSYALLLHARHPGQRAVFELRKLVKRRPTLHTAMALGFLVTVLEDMGSKPRDVDRARRDQIEHVCAVLAEVEDPAIQGTLLLQLGHALDQRGMTAEARAAFLRVLDLGDVIEPELKAAATAALSPRR